MVESQLYLKELNGWLPYYEIEITKKVIEYVQIFLNEFD